MIIFAGLGLNENTITREIIETIKNADKIIVINEGVVEKEGDHEFLISESQTYQRLYNAQINKAPN